MEHDMFEPEELAAVRAVFVDLVSQPWFSRGPNMRRDCARYLLDAFPGGPFRRELKRPTAEAVARARFANATDAHSNCRSAIP